MPRVADGDSTQYLCKIFSAARDLLRLSGMNVRSCISAFALALVLGTSFGTAAWGQGVDALLAERSVAERRLATVSDTFEQALAEFEELTDEIEALKAAGPAGPLDLLDLQQRMQQALAFSDTLEDLQQARDAAIHDLSALDAAHIAAVEAELDGVLQQRPWTEELAERADGLQRYLDDRATAAQSVSVPTLDLESTRASLQWSPEEMRAAADELADYQDAMQLQLEQLETAARQAQRREELEQRARSMRRQESLFDDSFSRRAPQAQAASGGQVVSDRSSADDGGRDSEPTVSRGDNGDLATGEESAPTGPPATDSDFGASDEGGGVQGEFQAPAFGPVEVVGVPEVVDAQAPSGSSTSPVDPTLFRVDDSAVAGADNRGRRRQSAATLQRQAEELRLRVQQAREQEEALRESAEETQRAVD